MIAAIQPPRRARSGRRLHAVARLLLAMAPALSACAQPARADRAALAARVDSLLQSEARDGFSGAVLIARSDTVLFDRAYGTAARVAGGAPAFWLASCSKQFTAAAILRLAERGRLRTGDSIARYLPRVHSDMGAITIHQLLTHTSGMPHAYRADGIVDRDRAMDAILSQRLLAKPGEKFSYSNDGYVLLAAIVETASGIPFDSYIQDSLVTRAGLAHTGLWGHERDAVPIAPVAEPGRVRGQRATVYREGHSVANWGYRGCTGVYATTRDVHAWILALRDGRVLGAGSLGELLGRHVLVRGDSTGQSYTGYGWGVRVEDGHDVSYGHVGDEDWLGHNAVIRFSPAGDVVVVLANSGERGGDGWAVRVNRALRRLLDPK